MTKVIDIKVSTNIKIHVESESIGIYKKGNLRCSGFEESIEYLLYHCHFNDICNHDALSILEPYQRYYISNLLYKNHHDQEGLTEQLYALHQVTVDGKYQLKFFRNLYRDRQFRDNIKFWKIIFNIYFDLADGKIGRLASRIILRNNLYDKEFWENLAEFYPNINYRKAVVKKILSDIKKNSQIKVKRKNV